MNASDKVNWITGASQGIGRSLALAWAQQGKRIVVSARSEGKLEELAGLSETLPGDIYPLPLDVTNKKAVANAVEQIEQQWGEIDQAVLNAGTYVPMNALDFSSDLVSQHLDLNVMGVCHCLEALIKPMTGRGRGQIAINASLSGYRGLPKAAAYGASKAALINMAESLYPELKEVGVDIRLINPGFVKTPLTDKNDFEMPFLISSEEAGRAIVQKLEGSSFEIRFPFTFSMIMSILRRLPYGIYFRLTRKLIT